MTRPDTSANPYEPPRAALGPSPGPRPRWVELGLNGLVPERTAIRAFLRGSLVLSGVGLAWACAAPAEGTFSRWFGLALGGAAGLAAAWYGATIRWMDRHRAW